jgi:hypothetical protein
MSTVVDVRPPTPDHPERLAVSAHAQVRYLERYVDARAVRRARIDARDEQSLLAALSLSYGAELASFRSRAAAAVAWLKIRIGDVPFETYTVKTDGVSVKVVGETAVTTLPPHDAPRRNRGRRLSVRVTER